MILIGSHALKIHFSDYFSTPKDVDIIGTEKEFFEWIDDLDLEEKPVKKEYDGLTVYNFHINNTFYEYEIAEPNSSGEDYLNYCKTLNQDDVFDTAPPEVLFSIKKSHINQNIKFKKHIIDYHFLINKNITDDKISDITTKRKKETDIRLKSKTPVLKQSLDAFITESQKVLNRLYDHDDIHTIVSHYNEPLYLKLQKIGSDVFCSKDLWNLFSTEDKILCVLEEAYVLAIERRIVPMLFQAGTPTTSYKAIEFAIIKIATTLSSGWFRDFTILNFFKILDKIDTNKIDIFIDELEKGNVKDYIDSTY